MRSKVDTLYVALEYVYAGQEETGLAFLRRHAPYYDVEVRRLLRADPLYRYVYGPRGRAYQKPHGR